MKKYYINFNQTITTEVTREDALRFYRNYSSLNWDLEIENYDNGKYLVFYSRDCSLMVEISMVDKEEIL